MTKTGIEHTVHLLKEVSMEAFAAAQSSGMLKSRKGIVFALVWKSAMDDDPRTDYEVTVLARTMPQLGIFDTNQIRPARYHLSEVDDEIVPLEKRLDRYTKMNAHPWVPNPDKYPKFKRYNHLRVDIQGGDQ